MNKKYSLLIAICLLSFLILSAYAQVSIGLKEGDWVEYTVSYTGTPPETYPEYIKIEVQTIQGTTITAEISRNLLNGTQSSMTKTFDIESGAPDLAIIPANLGTGDEVYHEDVGIFTIEGVAEYSFKGTTRESVYANIAQTELSWDRTTGILIKAHQTTGTFTQTLLGVNTNIVQTQASDIDPIVFYGMIVAAVAILIVAALLVLRRRK